MPIKPILLSGGAGTRLWPLSRQTLPKQFAPLRQDGTLFAATIARFRHTHLFTQPMIVSNTDHRFLVRDALDDAGVKNATIILEPMGRNTAAAAIIAALVDENASEPMLHLVAPSDHLITNTPLFHQAVEKGAEAARAGHIVLFGITPETPETGFGYILRGNPTAVAGIPSIAGFREKPTADVAASLIKEGALWNSGIFLYDPRVLLKEAERLNPAMVDTCRAALIKAQPTAQGVVLDKDSYAALPDQPFDRAIMEQTTLGAVIPIAMGWNDLGSWQSLWETEVHDSHGNASHGAITQHDNKNCYLRSEGPMIAALGLDNIAVVAMKDCVLVAPLDRAQDVKKIVAELPATHHHLATEPPAVRRPWGSYESIAHGQNFQVKHIVVKPGQSLSLQLHHHRAEHWIIVAGTATVECGEQTLTLGPNQSTYIPLGTKHRLSNHGLVDLQVIEVQSGEYLGEDDIVRFNDIYGRDTPLPN